ncbi:helix-turn-helix domain-containing protein [Rathayibacter sp. YIM 133350]|uniref:helix-turn-helix domain-containing protein n=1 Tax=Rathayibacter sp. YIM 133350 TaxID=3131992 RepID=UPI00307D98D6
MKFPALAALLRAARESKSLDQGAVARHLGLRQQAVSTWERGGSRPRLNQLPVLCELLGIDVDAARVAGGYESSAAPAGQPRIRFLPFDQLSDEAFEAFVRDLYRGLHPSWEVTRNGSTGFAQYGVDVFANGDQQRIGIQCKHEQNFGPKDVDAAVTAVLPEARTTSGLIALSRLTATPGARLEVAKNPGWSLWDGEDIAARVRELPKEKQLALVDAYFPRLREEFLGIAAPSPWLPVQEFEPALAGRLGYDRQFDLVGRSDELDHLCRLVTDHQPTVLVVGRGGIGKTRLLTEFARTDAGREVRFASRGPIAPDMFDLLPEGAPVVVLDDALSLDTNVTALVLGIRLARPDATVVLSVRPKSEADLLSALSIPSAAAKEVRVEVGDLTMAKAEELALQALGAGVSPETVELLARVGYDCPLIIVIGAHLIREGHLQPNALAGNGGLREEILTHFADVVMRGSNGDVRRAVLDAVATVQPARLDQAEFLDSVTGLSGLPQHVVVQTVEELEDLGVVMRRGQSVRVVPDLLGEAVLERVLVSRTGIDTKWATRVGSLVRGDALGNAIRNVSLVDWYRRGVADSRLGESLWEGLAESVLKLGNTDRKSMVHGVESVAAVYPQRAMELAELIMENPAPDEDDALAQLWGGEPYVTATSTNRALSGLIRNASYDPEQLERGMTLLFTIGRDDPRMENQNPDHALRVLREIGEYHPNKSVSINAKYIEVLGRWLNGEDFIAERARVLRLLLPVLADEVTITRSKGPSIEMSRRTINLDLVESLRIQVIELAGNQLREDIGTAIAAIEVLGAALRSGRHFDHVTPELRLVCELLGDTLEDPTVPASVRLSAYRALNWQAVYGEGEPRALARQTRQRLYIDADYQAARLLRAGWALDEDDEGEDDPDGEGAEQSMTRYQRSVESSQRLVDLVVDAWSTALGDEQVLEHLHVLMRNEQQASGGFLAPDHLLNRLFEARPRVARELLRHPTLDDAAVMASQRVAMTTLFAKEDPRAGKAAETFIGMGAKGALLVVEAVTARRGQVVDGERKQIVRALASLDSLVVSTRLVAAARWWEPDDHDLVLELIMAAPVDTDAKLAEAVAELLVDGRIVGWSDLTDVERASLLKRLVKTPSLDGYDFGRLLNAQIRIDPDSALQFLMDRVDLSIEEGGSYDALPYSWGEELAFRGTSSFARLLTELTDWMLRSERRQWAMAGSELFEQVAGAIDSEVLAVLLDLVRSGNDNRALLAARLMQNATPRFVLENAEFVEEVLKAAESLDEDSRRSLRHGLHSPALYGMRSRSVGVDDPEDVALRDGALAVAARHPSGSPARSFYEEVATYAEQRLRDERISDRSFWETRRW